MRKRLQQRIDEISVALGDETTPLRRLKELRGKLIANIQSHEKRCAKLEILENLPKDDLEIVDRELERSIELDMDSFESTIHLNEQIPKIDKFKYLLSLLEGEARDTLRGFSLTEGQYDKAVEQLTER